MARNHATTDLDRALAIAAEGQRVILRRGGQRFAVIGADDLARLEEADAAGDRAAAEAIDAALSELAASGAEPRPLEELLAELEL